MADIRKERVGFNSKINFSQPDGEAYTRQKSVHFIEANPLEIPELVELPLAEVPWMGESWNLFHGRVIALTASGHYSHQDHLFPRPFPGPIIPGPAHTEQYIGSSAIEIFDYLLTIPERVVDPSHIILDAATGEYLYDAPLPDLEFTPIPMVDNWIWDVPQPVLTQMQLTKPSPISPEELGRRKENIFALLTSESVNIDLVKRVLGLIQLVQTPYVRETIPNEVLLTAKDILDHYSSAKTPVALLPLLFQIESSLMFGYHNSKRDVFAKGIFGHSWIEASRSPVIELKSTELVDGKRAIDEVVNLIVRGWAPIITDERLNNTDGSHRGIAARIWSLIKHLDYLPTTPHDARFQEAVGNFVASRPDMVGLTLRESLRVAQILLFSEEYSQQRRLIFGATFDNPDVQFVPTILLREQEACCVVKSPFDNDGVLTGVDPFVTYTLTNGRSDLALGSRGPYHRTDKSPAPWINVFELQG